jgi:hypothetical protein
MTNYWIVVPRGNTELFDLLSVAFRGHTGFHVVVDRRGSESGAPETERRAGRLPLGPDEIVVAEQKERADRQAMGGETTPFYRHVPVRRRRVRPSASRASSSRTNPTSVAVAVAGAVIAC